MGMGGNSETLVWVIWTAWAGDNKSPARNKGSDSLESCVMKRNSETHIYSLESPGMKNNPLKARTSFGSETPALGKNEST